ncbi:S-adenosyl-L-methionine-dependent methyltransferase [Aspergillus spinulosporus]
MTIGKPDISGLQTAISQAAASPYVQTEITETERQNLYQACLMLSAHLETPLDRLSRSSFDFIPPVILRLAIDIGIFALFNKEDALLQEYTISEIATRTKTNQGLIFRIVRFLITFGVFDATPEGRCRANNFTKSFTPGNCAYDNVILLSGLSIPVFGRLPSYFRNNANKEPQSANAGVFQDALSTDLHVYDWLGRTKDEFEAFHQLMATSQSWNEGAWTELLPDKWFLQKFSSNSDNVTMVDVGGSSGKELMAFMRRLPKPKARLVLQDIPHVVVGKHNDPSTHGMPVDVIVSHNIEKMGHNFFNPQPVRGASLYILSRVLHNWPDKESAIILRNIHDAMNDQSTLLICDCVFQDKLGKVSYADAISDMIMMGTFSSLERSEQHFKELLQSVGLRMHRIWRGPLGSTQAVLEVVRNRQVC